MDELYHIHACTLRKMSTVKVLESIDQVRSHVTGMRMLQVPDGQLPAAGRAETGDAFEGSWAAYLQEATRLGLVFGAQSVDKAPVHHRQV